MKYLLFVLFAFLFLSCSHKHEKLSDLNLLKANDLLQIRNQKLIESSHESYHISRGDSSRNNTIFNALKLINENSCNSISLIDKNLYKLERFNVDSIFKKHIYILGLQSMYYTVSLQMLKKELIEIGLQEIYVCDMFPHHVQLKLNQLNYSKSIIAYLKPLRKYNFEEFWYCNAGIVKKNEELYSLKPEVKVFGNITLIKFNNISPGDYELYTYYQTKEFDFMDSYGRELNQKFTVK